MIGQVVSKCVNVRHWSCVWNCKLSMNVGDSIAGPRVSFSSVTINITSGNSGDLCNEEGLVNGRTLNGTMYVLQIVDAIC